MVLIVGDLKALSKFFGVSKYRVSKQVVGPAMASGRADWLAPTRTGKRGKPARQLVVEIDKQPEF